MYHIVYQILPTSSIKHLSCFNHSKKIQRNNQALITSQFHGLSLVKITTIFKHHISSSKNNQNSSRKIHAFALAPLPDVKNLNSLPTHPSFNGLNIHMRPNTLPNPTLYRPLANILQSFVAQIQTTGGFPGRPARSAFQPKSSMVAFIRSLLSPLKDMPRTQRPLLASCISCITLFAGIN
jgi:hypothetical protein